MTEILEETVTVPELNARPFNHDAYCMVQVQWRESWGPCPYPKLPTYCSRESHLECDGLPGLVVCDRHKDTFYAYTRRGTTVLLERVVDR